MLIGPTATGKTSQAKEAAFQLDMGFELVVLDDPLATVDGTTNAVRVRADPVGYVTITGPGAGPELAGQGVLSDLLAVARAVA